MRVLVLGGAGFLGRPIVARLVARGDQVTVFHRGTRPTPFAGQPVEEVRGDRRRDLGLVARDFDAIVDLAAFDAADVAGIVDLFRDRVGHYLAISSGAVFSIVEGTSPPGGARPSDYDRPLVERASVSPGQWAYAAGKRAVEDRLLAEPTFPATRLRLPAVFGAGDPAQRIERYVHRLLDGGPILLPVEGRRTRPAALEEVAATTLALLGDRRAFGRAIHQAPDECVSVPAFVEVIATELGSTSPIVALPEGTRMALDPWVMSPLSSGSILDPASARELGIGHAPLAVTLRRALARVLATLGPIDEESAAQRPREIALARALLETGAAPGR